MRGSYRLKLLWKRLRAAMLRYRAERSVHRFPQVRDKRPHGLDAELIVTLTSYPPRFADVAKTLRSLLDQTVQPDRVVLWIADADMKAVPAEILELSRHGLEIRACRDTRSYKKLVPALREWPDACFVTADDDVFYPPDWLDSLTSASKQNPNCVVGARVHMAHRDADGTLAPYAEWELATDRRRAEKSSELLFPTGVGGVLYPPGAFAPEVLDEDAFTELCPRGDDIWFFWMARRAGTTHCRARDWFDIVEWPGGQDVALYSNNLLGDGNNMQIRAMEERYGPVAATQPEQIANAGGGR